MADYSIIYGKCFTQVAFKVTRIHTGPGSNTMDILHIQLHGVTRMKKQCLPFETLPSFFLDLVVLR